VMVNGALDGVLALRYSIFDPVEAHIHCLQSALLDRVIDNSRGTFVVGLEQCSILWMP
jgi:hypothetical protein